MSNFTVAEMEPHKRCNCKKAKCLKLYCVCFSAGVYCNGCACLGCMNSLEYQDMVWAERQRILLRSPRAFAPKVEQKVTGDVTHKKGCRCRKSRCLKKYCECFDAGVNCSVMCRCEDCCNQPDADNNLPPGMSQAQAVAVAAVRNALPPLSTSAYTSLMTDVGRGTELVLEHKGGRQHGMVTRKAQGNSVGGSESGSPSHHKMSRRASGSLEADEELMLGPQPTDEVDAVVEATRLLLTHQHQALAAACRGATPGSTSGQASPRAAAAAAAAAAVARGDVSTQPSREPSVIRPLPVDPCLPHEGTPDEFNVVADFIKPSLPCELSGNIAQMLGMPSNSMGFPPSLAPSPMAHLAQHCEAVPQLMPWSHGHTLQGALSGALEAGVGGEVAAAAATAVVAAVTAPHSNAYGDSMSAPPVKGASSQVGLSEVSRKCSGAAGGDTGFAAGGGAVSGAGAAGLSQGPPVRPPELSPFMLAPANLPFWSSALSAPPGITSHEHAGLSAVQANIARLLRPDVLLTEPEAARQLALMLGLDDTHQAAAAKAAQILQSMLQMASDKLVMLTGQHATMGTASTTACGAKEAGSSHAHMRGPGAAQGAVSASQQVDVVADAVMAALSRPPSRAGGGLGVADMEAAVQAASASFVSRQPQRTCSAPGVERVGSRTVPDASTPTCGQPPQPILLHSMVARPPPTMPRLGGSGLGGMPAPVNKVMRLGSGSFRFKGVQASQPVHDSGAGSDVARPADSSTPAGGARSVKRVLQQHTAIKRVGSCLSGGLPCSTEQGGPGGSASVMTTTSGRVIKRPRLDLDHDTRTADTSGAGAGRGMSGGGSHPNSPISRAASTSRPRRTHAGRRYPSHKGDIHQELAHDDLDCIDSANEMEALQALFEMGSRPASQEHLMTSCDANQPTTFSHYMASYQQHRRSSLGDCQVGVVGLASSTNHVDSQQHKLGEHLSNQSPTAGCGHTTHPGTALPLVCATTGQVA